MLLNAVAQLYSDRQLCKLTACITYQPEVHCGPRIYETVSCQFIVGQKLIRIRLQRVAWSFTGGGRLRLERRRVDGDWHNLHANLIEDLAK